MFPMQQSVYVFGKLPEHLFNAADSDLFVHVMFAGYEGIHN